MNLRELFQIKKNQFWSVLYLGAVGLLFLAGVSGNTKPTWAQSGPTVINIGTAVQRSKVKRLGINIGGQTYYDSGQMLRDITFNNPGFEAEQWRSILTCSAVNGTTCTDGNGWSQWPTNFLQGGTFTFIYGKEMGKTGTLVSMTAASGNGGAPGWFNFGTVTPAVGDTFIIQKTIPGLPASGYGWWPSTSNGATITADTTDLSPETPGVQAASLNASGSGQMANETSYFDSTNGRSFLQMNGSYTVFFRAKGDGGANQMTVSVGRYVSSGTNMYFTKTIQLTSGWADYSYTFTANEDGSAIGTAFLSFTANSSKVLLDDASVTEAASASNNTPFRDAVVQRLQELNPGVLRYMDSGYDFGSTIDNMIAVPGARLRTGFAQNESVAFDIPLGLEEFLQLCQAVGAEPWYTMPMGMSPTEAQNLIQFLAGDASTPYGAKRAALGQAAPWTSVFPTIHLELGDEAWNTAFAGDTIDNAYAYGTRVGVVFGAARASSSFDASKFDLIMDGWASNSWWGQQAMNYASNAYDTIDAAPYTFDTFTDYSSNEAIFGSMFAEPEAQDSRASGEMYQQMQMVTGKTSGLTGKQASLAVYEVNLGTTSGTAPQSVLNSVIPSLGAGLSTAEHMLLMMRDDGVALQAMFALPEYMNGYTNNNGGGGNVQLWGTVVDMGGQTNLCRPQFLAEELANTAIGSTMLTTTQTGANPTWDENSPNDTYNPINITGAHYIQSFAFVNGTQNGLILFNLSRTSSLPVTFTGANAPSGTVQVGLLTSANLTDTNETGSKVAIANSTIQNFNPAATTNLPPYSMTVYQWVPGGGGTKPEPTPTTTSLSATPVSTTTGQTVSLTAAVNASTTATGSVVFADGGTTLGTSALSGGKVSLSVSNLAVGSHTLTATFQPNSSFSGSVSPAVAVKVAAAPLISTRTAITAPASVTAGGAVALSATVTAASGADPTGTVQFLAGSTVLGSASLSNGKASYTVSSLTLPGGSYPITASYGGNSTDGSSASSASTLTVVEPIAATTTTLSLPSLKFTEGASVTAVATVKAASGSAPTGTVNFYVGTEAVGTAYLSGGTAKLTINADLAPGTYQAEATYQGTSTDAASTSAKTTFTITAATVATATSLTSNTTRIVEGNQVALTASVTPQTPGVTATGAVTFYLGQTALGTGQLAGGQAQFKLSSPLAPGTYKLLAVYAGNGTDLTSTSNSVSLTVTADAAATSIQFSASPLQFTEGGSTVLTAKVSATGTTIVPSGTVNFYLGQSRVGSASLIAGVASSTYVANLAPGTYPLIASYAGNAQDNASSSTPVTITIQPSVVATTTSLTLSASQLTQGQSFTLTATVAPASGTSTPQGTVTFYLGQTQLGTATLVAGSATLNQANSLAAGSYQISAAYSGSAQDTASISNSLVLVIGEAPSLAQQPITTVTALTITPQQPTSGQTMMLETKVSSSASNALSGTVALYLGQTLIGTVPVSAGSAVMSMPAPQPGTYTVTAAFTGQTGYTASQSAPFTFTVQGEAASVPTTPTAPAGTFTLGLSSDSVTLGKAADASVQVMVAAVQGYTGKVQLSCAGLPASVTCNFAPAALAVNGSQVTSTLSFSANTESAQNPAIMTNVARGLLLPWDFIGALGFISGRRSKRGRKSALVTLGVLLLGSTVWMTGCGLTVNSISKSYQVNVTAVGQNQVTQTSTITVYVTQPAATF